MQSNNNTTKQIWKSQFNVALYSPRTTFSNHLKQIRQLKVNMIINIDKYILGSLKTQFEKRSKQISLLQFIHFSKKYLKDWNLQLYGRQVKIQECLLNIWKEIDLENKGKITWQQFNSKIIQTSLNLKSLANNAGVQAPTFKQLNTNIYAGKYQSPISKIIYIKDKSKMAYFRQQSTQIQFFNTQHHNNQSTVTNKPLILPQQQLKVQTIMKIKSKTQHLDKNKHKLFKKDVKVSSYKNTVLDMIFIDDFKYNILLVSCSDKYVRGYNVNNPNPTIAAQPENQDQPMVHQFPVQIYNMAWDSVNQILYATGKHTKIYQWIIKTDSQREMTDIRGHQKMISTLFMMPKLQLLASGGYDGKLILWDTVGQVIKCRYQQHTRAISSITFHQQLILLFTASYDHKICIWNPYIASLIHKIDNPFTIISIQIIPNTNFLLSLDSGGNVKVRQTSRFTQITAFSIFRSQNNEQNQILNKINSQKQKQISISMCSKKDGNIHYYFGTDKIVGYQYYQIQKSSISGGAHLCMKYQKKQFFMYTPLKNHVLIWNMLTGKIEEIFYDVMENDICSFEIIEDLNLMIVGDADGNVVLKRLNNGFYIKKLIKYKNAVTTIKYYQTQKGQKQKTVKKIYILFIVTQQGQIWVMKCNPKSQFQIYRQLSLKNDFSLESGSIVVDVLYFIPKNILILWLSSNQIIMIEVEKKNLAVKFQLGNNIINSINVITYQHTSYLVVLTKGGHVLGYYLPPSSKKFKSSCFLTYQDYIKIQSSIYSQLNQCYYVSTQSNQVHCIKLYKNLLQSQNLGLGVNYTNKSLSENINQSTNKSLPVSQKQLNSRQLKSQWSIKLSHRTKSFLLLQNEQILVLLQQNQQFTIISVETGQVITNLKNNTNTVKQPDSLLYFKEKDEELYIPNEDKMVKVYQQENQDKRVNKVIDPNYFIQYLKDKNIKNFKKVSNQQWPLNLKMDVDYKKTIDQITQIQQNLKKYEKVFDRRSSSQVQMKLQKAIQLQKKWQTQKQSQLQSTQKNINSLQRKQSHDKSLNRNSLLANYKVSRGNSLGSLWKYKENMKKTQHSSAYKRNIQRKQLQIAKLEETFIDINKIKNDPMYRLGLALKSVNDGDKKAESFIQLAKKKQFVRFPKIASQKLKIK